MLARGMDRARGGAGKLAGGGLCAREAGGARPWRPAAPEVIAEHEHKEAQGHAHVRDAREPR
jgi:hypothetical protein